MNKTDFKWCNTLEDQGSLEKLVTLFVENANNAYISHGEVIYGRANNLSEWKANIKERIREEFVEAMQNDFAGMEIFTKLVMAQQDENIVAIALVGFYPETKLCVLYDIVVDKPQRRHKIAEKMLQWIEAEIKKEFGARFLFLESGKNNHDAHKFFEHQGFAQSSIEMYKEILNNQKLKIMNKTDFKWCNTLEDQGALEKLVALFVENANNAYISHGEVIDGRADNLNEWKVNISELMHDEFAYAMQNDLNGTGIFNMLAMAKQGEQIVAVALVVFHADTELCVLSDIVVDKSLRGKKLGKEMLKWIEAQIKDCGARFLFLESGKNNHDAHKFFENEGFKQSSIVMVKEIS